MCVLFGSANMNIKRVQIFLIKLSELKLALGGKKDVYIFCFWYHLQYSKVPPFDNQ